MKGTGVAQRLNFVSPNEKAKSKFVAQMVRMARKARPVHAHLFRHQMLTFLTTKGLSDAQMQLISGHESKKSPEVYQHLSLESVDKA